MQLKMILKMLPIELVFGFGVNNKLKSYESVLFGVCLQNFDLYFNLYTMDNVYLPFSDTVWFFEF